MELDDGSVEWYIKDYINRHMEFVWDTYWWEMVWGVPCGPTLFQVKESGVIQSSLLGPTLVPTITISDDNILLLAQIPSVEIDWEDYND